MAEQATKANAKSLKQEQERANRQNAEQTKFEKRVIGAIIGGMTGLVVAVLAAFTPVGAGAAILFFFAPLGALIGHTIVTAKQQN
jgi:predicted lipid-binding transport protein (Tim44 family)